MQTRLMLLLTTLLSVSTWVQATQIMHRPDGYKSPPRLFPVEKEPKISVVERRATGKVTMGYVLAHIPDLFV